MAYAALDDSDLAFNPLDAVEQIATANGWACERQGDDEIVTAMLLTRNGETVNDRVKS